MMKEKEKHLHSPMYPFSYDKKQLSMATDARTYRNCILLSTGKFSDSITRSPVIYTEQALKTGATNWEENYLNVDHSYDVRDRLGFVTNPYYKNGKVYGDLNIFPITTVARDIISLIDANLVNWISVELYSEDDWNDKTLETFANNIIFIGAAVCLFPADSNTRIKEDGPAPYNDI